MNMIRPATHRDLEQIERLIQPYIADFAISREGEEKFSSAAILKLLNTEQVHYYVCEQNEVILGIIAYKEPAHLVHFFVDITVQKQGIGRKLWNYVAAELQENITTISVNSSCYAQPIYQKFGFETVSEVIEAYGLRYMMMQKSRTVEKKKAPEGAV
ncbi:GNAT family N-acetyltransferase [Acinetobacter tandoii]|uniref:GNAT family N-acetyltransferase n=1 Tax=Acinetobacter tandoii TaxID=202954 RepID=UPI002ADF0259|nr:GNAT family N-acetyltransferase [Acinetobacter tandoii]